MTSRGRPLSFDRDLALQRAMGVFWAKGYEGTQLVDLTSAMNINPPSFYAAFGNKKQAFYAAVDLYLKTIGAKAIGSLNNVGHVKDGLRAMLESSVDVAVSNESGGCLLLLGVVNHLPENEDVYTHLKEIRQNTQKLIYTRLEKAVAEGELSDETDIEKMAAYFLGIMQAISFQARDGASKDELRCLIEPAMAAIS